MQAELDNCTLYYEVHGEGRPLILLHGLSVDHRHMVTDFEPHFAQRHGWQRVYFDMPGMGQSNTQAGGIDSNDDMLAVILAFIDYVIPGQHFSLAGTSYGAYMGRGVLHERQESMEGLCLLVPPILPRETRSVPPHVPVVEDDDLLADVDPDIAEPFRGMAIVQSRPVLDRWEQDLTPAVALFDRELEPRLRARYTFSFDIDDLPQPFAGPSLIVAGRQDSECGYRDAWDIIENYPRGTYAVLDRSGHLVGVEQEAIVTALIGDWLDRVEEYAD